MSTTEPPIIDMDLCVLCDVCIENCPMEALSEVNGEVVVDSDACDPDYEDYACVHMCMLGAISEP